MTPPARPRAPFPSSPDTQSGVRECATPVPPASQVTPSVPAAPLAQSTSAGASRDRLEAKLRIARAVLAGLTGADDRGRLLHIAIMRRDEALLDGVLASLGMAPSVSVLPPSR